MYKIKIPTFEGPFDLLLYFIKRDELNIYDIPIAEITHDFLEYIKLMKIFDIELASEFIVMASNLIYIKTQMLLPRPKNDDEDEEIEDPRTQLVRQLLEYKKYKDASQELETKYEGNRYSFYREVFSADMENASADMIYKNSSVFDLVGAFQKMIRKIEEDNYKHVVELHEITVEEQSNLITEQLNKKKRISLFEYTKSFNKGRLVVTFLSILDLIKLKKIYIFQNELFDDIILASTIELN